MKERKKEIRTNKYTHRLTNRNTKRNETGVCPPKNETSGYNKTVKDDLRFGHMYEILTSSFYNMQARNRLLLTENKADSSVWH